MSLAAVCGWTMARTILLCLLAWPLIVGIERWLRGLPQAHRFWAFSATFLPFLFPELLVGYTYRDLALASPRRAEWICAALLLFRIVPVGVIALHASPAAFVGATAIHCRWILCRANPWSLSEWRHLAWCYWRGPVRRVLPALGLMSLVAFQEFELAALLQTVSWTDWFIAAQRVGLDRNEMFVQTLWPVAMQCPVLVAIACWASGKKRVDMDVQDEIQPSIGRQSNLGVISYLVLAFAGGCLFPLVLIAWNLPRGLRLLARQPMQSMGLGREILIASAISLCTGLTAWSVGSAWSRSRSTHRLRGIGARLVVVAWFGRLVAPEPDHCGIVSTNLAATDL